MKNIIPPREQAQTPPLFGDERLPQRFWRKIQVADDGCWKWTAQIGHHGYARYQLDGRSQKAHRVAYTALLGVIPGDMVVDHLCRVRHCVNPAHLEAVTNAENLRRGIHVSGGGGVANAAKTHCPQGHPYAADNLGVNKRGDRFCRQCKREQSRNCHARRAAAKAGA